LILPLLCIVNLQPFPQSNPFHLPLKTSSSLKSRVKNQQDISREFNLALPKNRLNKALVHRKPRWSYAQLFNLSASMLPKEIAFLTHSCSGKFQAKSEKL